MHEYTITKEVKKEIKINPCPKCANPDIDIWNCGFSSFNSSGGRCKKCNYEIECGHDETVDIIKSWNKETNIDKLLETAEKEVKRLKKVKQKIKRIKHE